MCAAGFGVGVVSTHSRPKAAAGACKSVAARSLGFNTQPPEGGCENAGALYVGVYVSTHSRPKAAASGS